MINVKQVVIMAKAARRFMLFERENQDDFTEHFFITPNFFLYVDAQEAFKLRCKLNIEKLGYWCEIEKGETVQGTSPVNTEEFYKNYLGKISEANHHGEPIVLTGLMIVEYNHFQTQCLLAAGKVGYTAIPKGQLEMILAGDEMRRAGNFVVVDGQQVLSIMRDDVWRGTPYLVKVKKEADDGED